ncbi:MAG: glycosyltransferase family 2 protein [Suipraeoptans sp.]
MQKKFVINSVRYKVGASNIVLIKGWSPQNHIDASKLCVYMNRQELEMKVEEVDRKKSIEVKQDTKTILIDKEYYIWVRMPKHYKKSDNLELTFADNHKNESIKKIPCRKIWHLKKDLYLTIDDVYRDDANESAVRGWIASPSTPSILVLDENKKIVPTEVKKRNRPDVSAEFGEVDSDNAIGFVIKKIPENLKDITIRIEYGEKTYDKECSLREDKVKKTLNKVHIYVNKAKKYYQRKGAIETFKHTIKYTLRRITTKAVPKYKYKDYIIDHRLTKTDLESQKNTKFEYAPKISLVVPLFNTPVNYLADLIDSVQNQTYNNWELCFSDGTGRETPLRALVKKYQESDERIKICYSDSPLQISENTNAAIEISTGEYIGFSDHDDCLKEDTFFKCIKSINNSPDIDMLYTDEDKMNMDGSKYFEPHFKPDFNIDLLRTVNYICHFNMVKKELLDEVGGLRSEYDGAQDYDFVLRCSEKAKHIYHIPEILYHWRAHEDSTAQDPKSKEYAFKAGIRAIEAHYERVGIRAKVIPQTEYENTLGWYRTINEINGEPLISIIIPNKDHTDDLNTCIRSIEKKSKYPNIEYIVVENNSTKKETFEYYEKIQKKNKRVKVVYWEREFNYSAINNYGASHAKGDYFLFMNNDIEIINDDCIEELLGYCQRPEVGIVGARLFYPDNTIQHAGVIVGFGGVAGHSLVGWPRGMPAYFAKEISVQDVSAVTAACILVKREAFESVDGFEEKLAVAFNDIDFCLRIREKNYLIVYNPYAELYHYESKSRGSDEEGKKAVRFQREVEFMKKRWEKVLEAGDPYYNPNLSLVYADFRIKSPDEKFN